LPLVKLSLQLTVNAQHKILAAHTTSAERMTNAMAISIMYATMTRMMTAATGIFNDDGATVDKLVATSFCKHIRN
jgi:nicotinamide mononucleotide (NMN) deamidase PncC